MSRPVRLEFPGAFWHVTNRGVEKRSIFLCDVDRRKFLELLSEVVSRFHWRIHAFVLMGNHFHLLTETLEPTLSRGMKELTGAYAEYFNWKNDRVGHLFQGRFKAHLVDSETYFLEVARYIVLNPVRAGMVTDPGVWPWSSYRATAGIEQCLSWLTVTAILDKFDRDHHRKAAVQYHDYVAARIGDPTSPWDQLVGQIYLGDETFVEKVKLRLAEISLSTEHPRPQRLPGSARLEDVKRTVLASTPEVSPKHRRLAFALLARDAALATLPQIGAPLGVRSSGASYLVRAAERLINTDGEFLRLVEGFRERLRNCRLET